MVVALVREEVVLLGRELDRPVVDGFQVTRRRRVNGVDFAAGLLLGVDMPAHGTRLAAVTDARRYVRREFQNDNTRYSPVDYKRSERRWRGNGQPHPLPPLEFGASRGGEN